MNQKYHVDYWTELAGYSVHYDTLEEAMKEYNKLGLIKANKIIRLTQTILLNNQIDGEFIE